MTINTRITPTLKTGTEPFSCSQKQLPCPLLEFWSWSVSDLVSNATRGRLAEFIVAKALGVDTTQPRDEWQAYDLLTPENIKIEVKSAAYIQSWHQKELSRISFSIKKAHTWNPDNNTQSKYPLRDADAYVFALLDHKDKSTVNPLNLDQWMFFILATQEINDSRGSGRYISLKALEKMTQGVRYDRLRDELLSKIKGYAQ